MQSQAPKHQNNFQTPLPVALDMGEFFFGGELQKFADCGLIVYPPRYYLDVSFGKTSVTQIDALSEEAENLEHRDDKEEFEKCYALVDADGLRILTYPQITSRTPEDFIRINLGQKKTGHVVVSVPVNIPPPQVSEFEPGTVIASAEYQDFLMPLCTDTNLEQLSQWLLNVTDIGQSFAKNWLQCAGFLSDELRLHVKI